MARLKSLENWDDIPNEVLLLSCIDTLTCAITETIDVCIPKCKSVPHQKHWWSQELMDRHWEVHRLAWRVYSRWMEPGDPIQTAHKEARRHYVTMIENTKKQHWDGFLTLLNEKFIWNAHRYTSGDPSDGSKVCIPTLKVAQTVPGSAVTRLAESNQEKSHLLQTMFFPELMHSEPNSLLTDYPRPRFDFNPVTNDQIHWAISKLGPHKAPGPDSIPNAVLVQCTDPSHAAPGPHISCNVRAGNYPDCWKDSIMIALRKPAKMD